jgi:hypothetical protein
MNSVQLVAWATAKRLDEGAPSPLLLSAPLLRRLRRVVLELLVVLAREQAGRLKLSIPPPASSWTTLMPQADALVVGPRLQEHAIGLLVRAARVAPSW